MSAALTTTTQPPLAYGDLERLADSIAKSGLFGIKTKEQAIVLMMISHAEGRHPALAARDFDIINGRPAKKAEAMMRDFVQAGGKVEWHALTDELADATFTHPQTGSVRIDWDMKRATTAFGKKDMYTKFPRQMLRSRVVSEGVRTLWPLATSGFHVPEEMADVKPVNDIEHEGPTIDHGASPEREAINASVPLRSAATAMPRGATVRAPAPVATDAWLKPLDEPNGTQWLKNLDALLANAQSQDEVVQIGGHHSVGTATAKAPPAVRDRISEMLAKAYAKFVQPESDAASDTTTTSPEELAEVRIEGEAKMAAG